ncbi:MAG: hypoxanthine/guanine phosphoribosyltransferase [Halobacteriales archaeon]
MDRLQRSIREAPIIDKDGYAYLVHPISNCVPTLDPELLREIVVGIIRKANLEDVDKIVTPAAMGIHISTAVSLMTDIPLVVVRKRSYGLEGEVALSKATGYSEGEMYINDVHEGDRVLVLDDLISTGGTMRAIVGALGEIGAEIVDIVIAIRKVGGEDALEGIPQGVKTLIDISVDGDGAEVVDPTGSG